MASGPADASARIDARIAELGDWRGAMLARVRATIRAVDPAIVEEWKWRGTPVWSRDGIVCTGESYQAVVKLTFAKGAALADPKRLFNASLDGNVRRAIDLHQGDRLDEAALQALVRAAIALNVAKAPARKAAAKAPARKAAAKAPARKAAAKTPARKAATKASAQRTANRRGRT